MFAGGEQVTLHPFDGFKVNAWGESGPKLFAADIAVGGVAVDPSPATQPVSADPEVRIVAVLYGWGEAPPAAAKSSHDEWTVRGERLLQEGPVADWIDPFSGVRMGWMVRLAGRLG